jgi:hypothetical protein
VALDKRYRAGRHARRRGAQPGDALAWEMRQLVRHLHAFVMGGLLEGAAHGFEQVLRTPRTSSAKMFSECTCPGTTVQLYMLGAEAGAT